MTDPRDDHGSDGRCWRLALGLVAGITLVRVVALLVWGIELVGDEAHYWEWSRRLDLSYYSKGPGVAWVIAAGTALFGDTEFGVRIGAVVSSALTMLALAWLGKRIGGARVGLYAVGAWIAMPVFHGTAMLMTIDGPYVLCWTVALCFAVVAAQRMAVGKGAGGALFCFSAAVGIGFLFKYTVLFLPAGLAVYALVARKRLVWTGGSIAGAAVGLVVFGVCISPVLIWNAEQGWPTIAHLLGHLGLAGGDLAHKDAGDGWSYDPVWTLEYVGAQIGLIGPLVVVMLGMGAKRLRSGGAVDGLLAWSGVPIVVVYGLVSLVTDVEGNWPIAGYAGLSLLVARAAPGAMDRWRAQVDRWRAAGSSDRAGIFRKQPETWFQLGWHWSLGYGIAGGVGILMIAGAARLPVIGDFVPMHRLSGGGALAEEVVGLAGDDAVIIAERYDTASLIAFYGAGRPRVLCASWVIGDRRTAYDYFGDTRIREVLGRGAERAVLVGGGERKWRRALDPGRLETVNDEVPIHIATDIPGMVEIDE